MTCAQYVQYVLSLHHVTISGICAQKQVTNTSPDHPGEEWTVLDSDMRVCDSFLRHDDFRVESAEKNIPTPQDLK